MNVKAWLKANPGLKVISILIAFLIWLIVVNVANPEIKETITLNLEIRNEEELTSVAKVYTLDEKSVRVVYKVRNADSSRISQDKFDAYIDLKDYSITGSVPIYVEPSPEIADLITIINISPMVVHVSTEDIQTKSFPLRLTTVGEAAEGYKAGEGLLSRTSTTVRGPVSEVGLISGVGIEVDVTGRSEDFSGVADLCFYDANGNKLKLDSRITYESKTGYTIPVYPVKTLSINLRPGGSPASGYQIDSVVSDPSFISVYGPKEILDQHSSIVIPESVLNVNNATTNITKSIDITRYIPEGLSLAQNSSEVAVIIRISRVITVPTIPAEEMPEMEFPVGPGETRRHPGDETEEESQRESEKAEEKQTSETSEKMTAAEREKTTEETKEKQTSEEKKNSSDSAETEAELKQVETQKHIEIGTE